MTPVNGTRRAGFPSFRHCRFFAREDMMMARNFRPHMMPWGAAAPAPAKRPATPTQHEPAPEDEPLKKDRAPTDSDHETESAASSDKDAAAPALATGVASSFARAGKLLWGNKNPLSGLAALTKHHSRTVSDFSESDFTTPFAPGTPVWTRYGLGTILSTRSDDGFLVVALQGLARITLYLNPADEDYYSVPAIRHDWVETPAGEGLVVAFDSKQQTYSVRLGGTSTRADVEVNVHRSDVRRLMPVRRQTHPVHQHASAAHAQPAANQEPSAIAKGFNSALKTIVTTSSGLTNSISNLYYHGQFVVTTFGSGTIVALDQTTHRVQVQLTSGAMAYLSTNAVLCYAKALEGMEVSTVKFGSGVVTEIRGADSMYGVKLHAPKEGEQEIVFVHESDIVRGRRTRLGSAQKQISEKIGASTTKLFSFAQNKVKLFGNGAAPAKAAPSPNGGTTSPSPSPATRPGRAASRSKSVRVVESDEEVSTAGI